MRMKDRTRVVIIMQIMISEVGVVVPAEGIAAAAAAAALLPVEKVARVVTRVGLSMNRERELRPLMMQIRPQSMSMLGPLMLMSYLRIRLDNRKRLVQA